MGGLGFGFFFFFPLSLLGGAQVTLGLTRIPPLFSFLGLAPHMQTKLGILPRAIAAVFRRRTGFKWECGIGSLLLSIYNGV